MGPILSATLTVLCACRRASDRRRKARIDIQFFFSRAPRAISFYLRSCDHAHCRIREVGSIFFDKYGDLLARIWDWSGALQVGLLFSSVARPNSTISGRLQTDYRRDKTQILYSLFYRKVRLFNVHQRIKACLEYPDSPHSLL